MIDAMTAKFVTRVSRFRQTTGQVAVVTVYSSGHPLKVQDERLPLTGL